MSSKSIQSRLDQRIPPEEHLTAEHPDVDNAGLGVDSDRREWWCSECEYRVTRASNGHGEYGHKRDCQHHYQLGDRNV